MVLRKKIMGQMPVFYFFMHFELFSTSSYRGLACFTHQQFATLNLMRGIHPLCLNLNSPSPQKLSGDGQILSTDGKHLSGDGKTQDTHRWKHETHDGQMDGLNTYHFIMMGANF